jgi:hypothetical protein
MEPFAGTVIRIACHHCAITDAVAVTVCSFVGIHIRIVVAIIALHAAVPVFVRKLS